MDAARGTELAVTNVVDIGPHYADTLRAWRAAWEEKKEAILACRQTDRFWRKFRSALTPRTSLSCPCLPVR